jgi:hypothetical protein
MWRSQWRIVSACENAALAAVGAAIISSAANIKSQARSVSSMVAIRCKISASHESGGGARKLAAAALSAHIYQKR